MRQPSESLMSRRDPERERERERRRGVKARDTERERQRERERGRQRDGGGRDAWAGSGRRIWAPGALLHCHTQPTQLDSGL
jgi:hypothetical protein